MEVKVLTEREVRKIARETAEASINSALKGIYRILDKFRKKIDDFDRKLETK